jgi:hypothetical protein
LHSAAVPNGSGVSHTEQAYCPPKSGTAQASQITVAMMADFSLAIVVAGRVDMGPMLSEGN